MEAAPEFFQTGYYEPDCFSPETRLSDAQNADQFVIEDLFDFPNDDTPVPVDAGLEAAVTGNSADSSPVVAADASFSLVVNATEPHFPTADNGGPRGSAAGQFAAGELCVPYDDMAGLEWVSKFVDESFCSEDLQTNVFQFQPENVAAGSTRRPEVSVPAKARSKRSRAAPGNWTSRLQAVSPSSPVPALSSSSESDVVVAKKAAKPAVQKKKDVVQDGSTGGEGRKCLHCAADKTPQWRTGPMGPKTLCNACGVRYKSGRLVPEYRPASSPTFVMAKHSNSHRKVLELRRQKEMQKAQSQPEAAAPYLHHHHHHHQNVMYDVPSCDDYLINPHIGADYRQMI